MTASTNGHNGARPHIPDVLAGAYRPEDAYGFIQLNALPLKMAHRQKQKLRGK